MLSGLKSMAQKAASGLESALEKAEGAVGVRFTIARQARPRRALRQTSRASGL